MTVEQGNRFPRSRWTRRTVDQDIDPQRVVDDQAIPKLDHVEAVCRAILAEHDLPDDPDRPIMARRADDGRIEWRDPDVEADDRHAHTFTRPRHLAGVGGIVEPDSRLGFACRCLDAVLRARAAIEHDDKHAALDHALDAGRLWTMGRLADWQSTERQAGGAAGGSRSKRKAWADALAKDLAGLTFVEAWDAVPIDPAAGDEYPVNTAAVDYGYYRDEHDRVVAIDRETGAELGTLRRATFRRHYFQPRQRSTRQ